MNFEAILHHISVTGYSRRGLFVLFLVLASALTLDVSVSDRTINSSNQSSSEVRFWTIATFTIIAGIFVVAQFLILNMIKSKNNEAKLSYYYHNNDLNQHYHHHNHQRQFNADILHNTVTMVQYVLAAIMVFTLLQILLASQYYIYLLTIAVTVSYSLATFLVGVLAYRLFSWYKVNKSLVILIYALAYCIVAINAIDSLIFFDTVLFSKPSTIITYTVSSTTSHGITPSSTMTAATNTTTANTTTMPILPLIQINSLVSYFILTWAATIILLIHNAKRLGKLKIWVLIAAPSVYFLSYYLSQTSQITMSVFSSGVVTGTLIAISFWSMSRSVSRKSHVRDYMIITGFGFVIFFTAGSATVIQAGYPPFGLANVSSVGLAAYLIMIGLYQSAISVAQDAKLRQSIKSSALEVSSKFLDNIGKAQMEKQIADTVMKMTKDNASTLEEQSGISPSLTEGEIESYLNEVIAEIVKSRK